MRTADYPEVPDDFGHWLAGFIDGEGSFTLKRARDYISPRFGLHIRADDLAIIEEIQTRTGIGRIYRAESECQTGNGKPRVIWQVQGKQPLARLVEILEEYPLRAKKRRDFEIWKQAVEIRSKTYSGMRRGLRDVANRRLAFLKKDLEDGRLYREPVPEACEWACSGTPCGSST